MTVFITGGSRGIGRALVLHFAQAGHDVAFTWVHNAEAAQETVRLAAELAPERRVQAWAMDVRDSARVEVVVDEAIESLGDFDAVINNAGSVQNSPAVFMSDEQWNDVIATNLTGPFFVARQFLMHFVSRRFGRIINISSIAQHGSSGQVNYAAAKAGLVGMTQTLAREYGPKGITANIVALGYVPTDMTADAMDHKLKDYWMQWCPARRAGTPEDVGALVGFLCSPQAGFINGEVLHLTGGLGWAP